MITKPGERYPPDQYRAVVVKDDPNAMRPWRWSLERLRTNGWTLVVEGRASARRVAWRRVHKRAASLPWKVDREEALIMSDSALVKSVAPPPPVPATLTPELLP